MLKAQQDRNQLQMFCLENVVAQDNIVRVIDAFVDALDLKQIGFITKGEREAQTNMEAIWLLRGATPGYKTIADFRKDNPKALKKVFKLLNRFLHSQDLFDTQTVARTTSHSYRQQNS